MMSNDLRGKVPAVACFEMVKPPSIADWSILAPMKPVGLEEDDQKGFLKEKSNE
jgi:hypothetical protein